MVGSAGLAPTLAAIECGAALAIANKETLVMAGAIVMPAARKAGVAVLPVDSEHSAIFQCLAAGRRQRGPARGPHRLRQGAAGLGRRQRAAAATVADALKHPTWQMGRKITIDSATLINKALEVVEAHWLFDLPAEQIQVVLHGRVDHPFVRGVLRRVGHRPAWPAGHGHAHRVRSLLASACRPRRAGPGPGGPGDAHLPPAGGPVPAAR